MQNGTEIFFRNHPRKHTSYASLFTAGSRRGLIALRFLPRSSEVIFAVAFFPTFHRRRFAVKKDFNATVFVIAFVIWVFNLIYYIK